MSIPESVVERVYERYVVGRKNPTPVSSRIPTPPQGSETEKVMEHYGREAWNKMTELEREQAAMRKRMQNAKSK